jgi:hypothetical protein
MVLGSTQPLTEMSTRNLPGGEERPARKADNLTAICEPIVYIMWDPQRLTPLWTYTACYRDSFLPFTCNTKPLLLMLMEWKCSHYYYYYYYYYYCKDIDTNEAF